MKIGLALSGGTLRGAAHIGVLDVLLQAGIRPHVIAGTSAGSVVAGLYAHGLPPQTLEQIASSLRGDQLIDWSGTVWDALRFWSRVPFALLGLDKNLTASLPIGLVKGRKLEKYLQRLFELAPRRTPTSLLVTSVDLYSAETVVFTDVLELTQPNNHRYQAPGVVYIALTDANRAAAVRASCSLPGVITPCQLEERTLIDGAIRNSIPAELLFAAGCDKVIAVDLLHAEFSHTSVTTFLDVFARSIDIMVNDITALQLRDDNIFYIRPEIYHVPWTAFDQVGSIVEQGRAVARQVLPELRRYLEQKKPTGR